jgi:predicted MFS family arabinose efflux permease
LAILPASVVAGALWDRIGPAAPFWFGAAMSASAMLLFMRPQLHNRTMP